MIELREEHKAVLALARDADEPPVGSEERVRQRVATRLGAAAGLATALASLPSVASKVGTSVRPPAAFLGSLAGKLVVAASAVAGVSALTFFVARGRGAPPRTSPMAATASTAAATATAASTVEVSRPEGRAMGVPSAPPFLTPDPSASGSLEAEVRLVQDGDTALRANDPTMALALFDRHEKLFPGGVLAEERSGERILALCALGRVDEARAFAAGFLRAHDSSPLAARVRSSCAGRGGLPR